MTHDVAEDVDIYSDLTSVNYSDTLKQLETSNSRLLEQVESLKLELSGTLKEKEGLEKQCQILSHNISSLFKTAQAEIERKNRTISELRSEINNVLFRRNNKMGGSWSSGRTSCKPESESSERDPRKVRNENSVGPRLENSEGRLGLGSNQNGSENFSRSSNSKNGRDGESSEHQLDKSDRKVTSSSRLSTTSREETSRRNCLSRSLSNDKNSEKISLDKRRASGESNKDRRSDLSRSKSSRQYSGREDSRDASKKRHRVEPYRNAYRTRSRSRQLDDLQVSVISKSLFGKDQPTPDENQCSQSDTSGKSADCKSRIFEGTSDLKTDDEPTHSIEIPNNNEMCNEAPSTTYQLDNLLTNEDDLKFETKKKTPTNLVESSGTVVLTEYSKRMLKKIQGSCTNKITNKTVPFNVSSTVHKSATSLCKDTTKVSVTSLEASLKVPCSAAEIRSPLIESKEEVITSQTVDVKSKIIVPETFSAISSTLNVAGFKGSIDLSVNSCHNSDIGEPKSSKVTTEACTNLVPKPEESAEKPTEQVDHPNKDCNAKPISQSIKHISELVLNAEKSNQDKIDAANSSPDLLVALNVDTKPCKTLQDVKVKQVGEAAVEQVGEAAVEQVGEAAVKQVGEATVKQVGEATVKQIGEDAVKQVGEATVKSHDIVSNVCADSILCSNSIQDLLNSSGGKHVNYELFSLESIDTFSLSPTKLSSKPTFSHSNTKVTLPPSSNKHRSPDSANPVSLDINDKHPSSNLNCKSDQSNKILNLNSGKESNEQNLNELTVHDITVKNGWKEINGAAEPTANPSNESTNENKSTVLSAVCISENESIKLNNQVVESYSSKIIQVKKKNGIQPIIKPISALWSKSIVKNDSILNSLSLKSTEEKTCLDRLVKTDLLNSKSDLVNDIFGSPVKWADSDSTDFIPPTIDKDPSVFEDSCSVSEAIRLKTSSEDSVDHKLPVIKDKNNDNSDSSGTNNGGNEKVPQIIENKFKHNLISSCLKMQSARYEDSILGQFEDTLQFVSALSKSKKTVSPIGTPEKFVSEKSSEDSNKPFSTLSINQKAGFKIVGPNEKPINILVPRKKPRVVSPAKSSSASTPPGASESKHCRISCIDAKAIESVCNLVSSIKDTHRETYLIISKKNKNAKHSSPKKLDNCENHLSKTKSPNSAKISPKSSLRSGNCVSTNKSDKNSPGKKFTQLKFSPKKKTLMKLGSTPNSSAKDSTANAAQIITPSCSTESPNICDNSPSQKKCSRTQLIDNMPLFPKTNNCTKVRMSYELKKPSRMSSRIARTETSSTNMPSIQADLVHDKVGSNKVNKLEETIDEQSSASKNVLNISSKLDLIQNSKTADAFSIIDKISKEANISNNSASHQLSCVAKRSLLKRNVSTSDDKDMLSKLNGKEVKDTSERDLIDNRESKPNQNRIKTDAHVTDESTPPNNAEIDKIVLSRPEVQKNTNSKSLVKTQEETLNIIRSDKSSANDFKSNRNSSVKSKNVSPSSSISVSKRSSSSRSNKYPSTCQPSDDGKQRKTSSSGLSRSSRMKSPSDNRLKSQARRDHSESHSRQSLDIKDHYYKRFHRDTELSYRQRLSRKYSSYRRREPSVCRRSRSSRRDSISSKYSRKSDSYRRRTRSPNAKRSVAGKDVRTYPESQHSIDKSSWGTSKVETVSLSTYQKFDAAPPYDRINGISCNNIVWRLIPVYGVPDWPKRKIPPDTHNDFSPIQTPVMSPSPSSGIMSPRIIVKKRAFNFSSSDVKTESFSSSPNKSNSSSQQSSFESRVFKTPPKSSTSLQKLRVSKESNNTLPLEMNFTINDVKSGSDKDNKLQPSKETVTSSGTSTKNKESNKLPKCKNSNLVKKSSKSDLSYSKEASTVTYRIPSFIKKSSGEEVKTVNLKKIKQKYCEVFSPPRNVKKDATEYATRTVDSDEGACTDSPLSSSDSFTSDESWVPKKKKKKR